MLIRDIRDGPHARVGDRSVLCELLHPAHEEGCANRYSLSHAVVPAGEKTLPHLLKTASETYYVLAGEGRMHIGEENAPLREGQAVYIPPGAVQWIENTGEGDLLFLAIVDPMWSESDEEIC
ncbi:cupin domain-containing protein [Methanofollis fontis]|uniref:Cupin domain-containing protein n=1 Tax=Methanofollis fontis TaxID=2052832 RepID=A0A483CRP5_9EURY|nr:cupin domain-containing protein [Methanofollis fontis]TAJ45498.1 cupin domain-containing protein [Methanofollis fontis]